MPASTDDPDPPHAPTLDGQSVRLRPATSADRDRLREILLEPSVAQWWGPRRPGVDLADDWLEVDADAVVFAIELQGAVIGSIQYSEEADPDYRHAGIDLFVATAWQGLGLGTDAIRTMARFLFEVRKHHRIVIDPSAANGRAIAAYRKVGFVPVGIMRSYECGPDGTFHDGLLLDLLANELT